MPHDWTQEPPTEKWNKDAQLVFAAHIGIEQAWQPQPLDARPATVAQLRILAALVLAAEQQDVETGTQ